MTNHVITRLKIFFANLYKGTLYYLPIKFQAYSISETRVIALSKSVNLRTLRSRDRSLGHVTKKILMDLKESNIYYVPTKFQVNRTSQSRVIDILNPANQRSAFVNKDGIVKVDIW